MGSFVNENDIRDSALVSLPNAKDLIEANNYIYDLAKRRGVEASKVLSDTSTPFIVKRLAVAYACMIRCQNNAGKNSDRINNGVNDDLYLIKFEMYRKQVAELSNEITREVLTGTDDEPSERANIGIALYRG